MAVTLERVTDKLISQLPYYLGFGIVGYLAWKYLNRPKETDESGASTTTTTIGTIESYSEKLYDVWVSYKDGTPSMRLGQSVSANTASQMVSMLKLNPMYLRVWAEEV